MDNSSADAVPESPPAGFPRIVAHLIYDDVDAAIDWLTEVFGFRERIAARHTEEDGRTGRAQIEVADSLITIGRPSVHGDSPSRGVSSMLYVYIDDVKRHWQDAAGSGATIIVEPHTHAGDRRYQVADPEGHQWTFAQHQRHGGVLRRSSLPVDDRLAARSSTEDARVCPPARPPAGHQPH